MNLDGVKRGDRVVILHSSGAIRQAEVSSAGPRWVGAGGYKFRRCDGFVPDSVGTGTWAHTLDGWRQRVDAAGADEALSRALAAIKDARLQPVDKRALAAAIADVLGREEP